MASGRRMPPYRRLLRDNIYMNGKHIPIDSRRRIEDMAKKSGKKKDEKTVDEFIPIVDFGDEEDEIDFENALDVLDDDTDTTDPKHPDITSDDLDAYVHDGGIDCYEKTPIMDIPQAPTAGYIYPDDPDDTPIDWDGDGDIAEDFDAIVAPASPATVIPSEILLKDWDEVMPDEPSGDVDCDGIGDDDGDTVDGTGCSSPHGDVDREEMLKMLERMDGDLCYDELPDYAKPYDEMVDGVLQLRAETAEKMYDSCKAHRYLDDIDMRAFMSYGSTVPFMASKPVDDLCVKYGLGMHDAIDTSDSISGNCDGHAWKHGQARGLLWSETVPTIYKPDARKNRRENSDSAAVDELIADGFRKGAHLRKKFDIDGGAIRRCVADGEKWGFDTRQCWNLDSFIPTMLYPRFAWLRDNAHGYDASFPDENTYNKKVMNPIIDALELHLVFYTIGDGDAMIEAYRKKNGLSDTDAVLIEGRIMQRIRHGYYLIAKHLFGFWD